MNLIRTIVREAVAMVGDVVVWLLIFAALFAAALAIGLWLL